MTEIGFYFFIKLAFNTFIDTTFFKSVVIATACMYSKKNGIFLKCVTRKFDRKCGLSDTARVVRIGQNFIILKQTLPYPILPCT